MNRARPKNDLMRQLSLALKSITDSRLGVSKDKLMRLIGLDCENASDDKQFYRLIERLQGLGYPVTHNPDSGRYYLDTRRIFEFTATDVDLTLLKTAIRQAQPRSTHTALVLENALAKLHATATSQRHAPNVAADIPDEDLLVQIVSSIERKKRTRFAYTSTNSSAPQWRIFDPYLVFSRSRVFYVCGRASVDTHDDTPQLSPVDFDADDYGHDAWESAWGEPENFSPDFDYGLVVDSWDDWGGDLAIGAGAPAHIAASISSDASDAANVELPAATWQWRTYRISRIDGNTYKEIGGRSSAFTPEDAREKVSAFFEAHDVILAIRPEKAHTLRSIAKPLPDYPQCPTGWDCYRIAHIDRLFLFERLMTYGADVRLLAPSQLRDDWFQRIEHLANMGVK